MYRADGRHMLTGEVVKAARPPSSSLRDQEPASAGSLNNGSQSHGWGRAGGRTGSQRCQYMTVAKKAGTTNARKMVTVKEGCQSPGRGTGQARPGEEPSHDLSMQVFFPRHPPSTGPLPEGPVAASQGRL